MTSPLKKQDTQVVDLQAWRWFLFLASLLPLGAGWCANKLLQPTRSVALGSSRSLGLFYVAAPAWLVRPLRTVCGWAQISAIPFGTCSF